MTAPASSRLSSAASLRRRGVGTRFRHKDWPSGTYYKVIEAGQLRRPMPSPSDIPVQLIWNGKVFETTYLDATSKQRYIAV